jgi:hypothetical protein
VILMRSPRGPSLSCTVMTPPQQLPPCVEDDPEKDPSADAIVEQPIIVSSPLAPGIHIR